jgi:hypothetical protein
MDNEARGTGRVAHKHQCTLAISTLCTRGTGKPKRQRCSYCGGSIRMESGIWGVFQWTGKGDYPLSNALATFTSRARADVVANQGDNTVVRWIRGES